ncbi:hypothetical protein FVE85_9209 [Porphyridium purpureum]|uniref:Uncharacterized protein n=1 Tax=Porphyridium purpureum TaxID=35688 RepID=A0A5J4YR98_PORPP|nr:hypothetical protein FVE85_9209 [Porphyridium purpureum]|eukprot:POR8218..scf222_8
MERESSLPLPAASSKQGGTAARSNSGRKLVRTTSTKKKPTSTSGSKRAAGDAVIGAQQPSALRASVSAAGMAASAMSSRQVETDKKDDDLELNRGSYASWKAINTRLSVLLQQAVRLFRRQDADAKPVAGIASLLSPSQLTVRKAAALVVVLLALVFLLMLALIPNEADTDADSSVDAAVGSVPDLFAVEDERGGGGGGGAGAKHGWTLNARVKGNAKKLRDEVSELGARAKKLEQAVVNKLESELKERKTKRSVDKAASKAASEKEAMWRASLVVTKRSSSANLLQILGEWKNRGGDFSSIWALENVCYDAEARKFQIHPDDEANMPLAVLRDRQVETMTIGMPRLSLHDYEYMEKPVILCRGTCDLSVSFPTFYQHGLPLWSILRLFFEKDRSTLNEVQVFADAGTTPAEDSAEAELMDVMAKSLRVSLHPRSFTDLSMVSTCFKSLVSFGTDYFGLVRKPEDALLLRAPMFGKTEGDPPLVEHCADEHTHGDVYFLIDYVRRPMLLNRVEILKLVREVLGSGPHIKTVDVSDADLGTRVRMMNSATFVLLVNGMKSSGDIAWLPRESHVVEILPSRVFDKDYMRMAVSLGLNYFDYQEENETAFHNHFDNLKIKQPFVEKEPAACWNSPPCRKVLVGSVPLYVTTENLREVLVRARDSWKQKCSKPGADAGEEGRSDSGEKPFQNQHRLAGVDEVQVD